MTTMPGFIIGPRQRWVQQDGTPTPQFYKFVAGLPGASPPLPVVTGSKGGNAALTSLMSALVSLGLVTDNTT